MSFSPHRTSSISTGGEDDRGTDGGLYPQLYARPGLREIVGVFTYCLVYICNIGADTGFWKGVGVRVNVNSLVTVVSKLKAPIQELVLRYCSICLLNVMISSWEPTSSIVVIWANIFQIELMN